MAKSGWCLNEDQYHDGCQYKDCTCPNHKEEEE